MALFNSEIYYNSLLGYMNKSDDEKEYQRQLEYNIGFLEKIISSWKLKGENLATTNTMIMFQKLINGHCGCFRGADGKLHIGKGTFQGNIDADTGLGNRYTVTMADGTQYTGEIGKDIVVLKNNSMMSSTLPMIERYSDMLSKCDSSMEYNIIYTRVCPIPIVETEQELSSMKKVIDNLFKNRTMIFKRSIGKNILGQPQDSQTNKLDLTNPQATQYLQHLSRFHDEWIIRACLEFGVIITARDKGAQLNESELKAFEGYGAITSTDMNDCLLEFIKEVKEVFNEDLTLERGNFITISDDLEEKENTESEVEENESEKLNGNMENNA